MKWGKFSCDNEQIFYFYLDKETHELLLSHIARQNVEFEFLPKNYLEDLGKSYPVVYFHDGQMFFIVKSLSAVIPKIIPIIKRDPDLEKWLSSQLIMMESIEWMNTGVEAYKEVNIPGVSLRQVAVRWVRYGCRQTFYWRKLSNQIRFQTYGLRSGL